MFQCIEPFIAGGSDQQLRFVATFFDFVAFDFATFFVVFFIFFFFLIVVDLFGLNRDTC